MTMTNSPKTNAQQSPDNAPINECDPAHIVASSDACESHNGNERKATMEVTIKEATDYQSSVAWEPQSPLAILAAIAVAIDYRNRGLLTMSVGTEFNPDKCDRPDVYGWNDVPDNRDMSMGMADRLMVESYADRSPKQLANENASIVAELSEWQTETMPQSTWPMNEWSVGEYEGLIRANSASERWLIANGHGATNPEFKPPSTKRNRHVSLLWCVDCGLIIGENSDQFYTGNERRNEPHMRRYNNVSSRRERIVQSTCTHERTHEHVMDTGAEMGSTCMTHNMLRPTFGEAIAANSDNPETKLDRRRNVTYFKMKDRPFANVTKPMVDMDADTIGRQLIGTGKWRIRIGTKRADQGKIRVGRVTNAGYYWLRMHGTIGAIHKDIWSDVRQPGAPGTSEYNAWWNRTVQRISDGVRYSDIHDAYEWANVGAGIHRHANIVPTTTYPIGTKVEFGPFRKGLSRVILSTIHYPTRDGKPVMLNANGTVPKRMGNGSGGKTRRRRSAKAIKAATLPKDKTKVDPTDVESLQTSPIPMHLRVNKPKRKSNAKAKPVVAEVVTMDAEAMLKRGLIG